MKKLNSFTKFVSGATFGIGSFYLFNQYQYKSKEKVKLTVEEDRLPAFHQVDMLFRNVAGFNNKFLPLVMDMLEEDKSRYKSLSEYKRVEQITLAIERESRSISKCLKEGDTFEFVSILKDSKLALLKELKLAVSSYMTARDGNNLNKMLYLCSV